MPAEIRADAETMFDELDNENHGFITDKDNIYALFLGMGVTFESEEDFENDILAKIVDNTAPEE